MLVCACVYWIMIWNVFFTVDHGQNIWESRAWREAWKTRRSHREVLVQCVMMKSFRLLETQRRHLRQPWGIRESFLEEMTSKQWPEGQVGVSQVKKGKDGDSMCKGPGAKVSKVFGKTTSSSVPLEFRIRWGFFIPIPLHHVTPPFSLSAYPSCLIIYLFTFIMRLPPAHSEK